MGALQAGEFLGEKNHWGAQGGENWEKGAG